MTGTPDLPDTGPDADAGPDTGSGAGPDVGAPVLRRLHPDPAELPLEALYAGLTLPAGAADQPAWVGLCMVTSLDGAVSIDGRSGGLGGPADLLALSRLRGSNDVSIVGAGTVRDERYGPLTGGAARRADRRRRGLAPSPRLAIITSSGQLDPELPVFGDPTERPLVLVSGSADPAALARLRDIAEVHVIDEVPLAPATIVGRLVSLGFPRILCEGGPRLNQAMLEADLIDEAFLTLAPTAVGGPAPRIISGATEVRRDLDLVSVMEHDGDLLLRYRHPRHRGLA
jgi:riboflavin biosynthesis pyrimidine reductase